MKPIQCRLIPLTLVALAIVTAPLLANNTSHVLSGGNFSQDWSSAGLITTDDNWSSVPSIEGYRGDLPGTTAFLSLSPGIQTHVGFGTGPLNVEANETNPDGFANGGVAEFALANPVVGLQGSGTADAPFLLLYVDSTGRSQVTLSYTLRDIDGSSDDAVQQIALQYRLTNSGNFTNVVAGYVNDATAPNTATLVTPVVVSDPAWSNQPTLQIRIMTGNAAGTDEWVGIDNITVTSIPEPATSILLLLGLGGFARCVRRR